MPHASLLSQMHCQPVNGQFEPDGELSILAGFGCENLCIPAPLPEQNCSPGWPAGGMIWQELLTAPPSGAGFNPEPLLLLDLSPFFKALLCNGIWLATLATLGANAALRCWHRSCSHTVGL